MIRQLNPNLEIVEMAALPGHLPGDAANQARLPVILERLRSIASLQRV